MIGERSMCASYTLFVHLFLLFFLNINYYMVSQRIGNKIAFMPLKVLQGIAYHVYTISLSY